MTGRVGRFVVLTALVGLCAVAPSGHAVGAVARTAPEGEVVVAAASSLTEVFEAIGDDFERRHEAVSLTFNFSSSSTLEAQLEQGAPGDVFASADVASMDELVAADGTRGEPRVFATNRLAIAVEPGNPKRIRTLADTIDREVELVLCAPEVPCGEYAREAYDRAGVEVPEVPTGLTAKDTLTKVVLGEADAAVVYATDVRAARGDVTEVKIPPGDNVVAEYPIAVVRGSEHPSAARAFVRYVLSPAGRQTLSEHGFLPA